MANLQHLFILRKFFWKKPGLSIAKSIEKKRGSH